MGAADGAAADERLSASVPAIPSARTERTASTADPSRPLIRADTCGASRHCPGDHDVSRRGWLLVGAVLAVAAAVLVWTGLGSRSGWQVQASHMAPFAVRFINQRDGWVAGDGGVLRTVDGGRHWRKVEGKYAADVFVLDPTHVWAVGPHGMIWGPEGTWESLPAGGHC